MAGHGQGMAKGSGTRSGLLWEVERILYECDELPQVLLMENVPQVHNKKNMVHFEEWINSLKRLGYTSFWQDLNAKDYGIPQNRNRCFMISILGDYTYEFPKPFPLEKKLKDMLEEEVDEKYFLSEKMLDFFYRNEQKQKEKGNGFRFTPTQGEGVAKTITTRAGGRMDDNFIKENHNPEESENMGGNFLMIKNATKKGYLEAYEGDGVDISSRMAYHRGTVQRGMIQTLDTQQTKGVVVSGKRK